jgi:diguanylate cyclase (GGDEF)-like protein
MAVLVVDNAADIRLLLRRYLELAGFGPVFVAASAREAFRALELEPSQPQERIRLVLMDIEMPEMDGIAACRALKEDPRFRDLPVLMVTSHPEDQELQAAFAAGAADYIRKPVNRSVLVARVQAALRLVEETERRRAREEELLRTQAALEQANRELALLASLDGLTGVANRRRFDERLAEEWARAGRAGAPLSLLLVDVDHFKRYNDTYGHLDGDACLRRVAQSLAGAGHRAGDLLARYGGEEFVVILPGTGAAGARAAAERMRAAVEGLRLPHATSPISEYVTVSVGAATAEPARGGDPAGLVRRADRALYRAKQGGRNRVAAAPASPDRRLAPAGEAGHL